jgi:hypothetical protein
MQSRVLRRVAGAVPSLAALNAVTRGAEETVIISASLAVGQQGAISFESWGFRPGVALSPWCRADPCYVSNGERENRLPSC